MEFIDYDMGLGQYSFDCCLVGVLYVYVDDFDFLLVFQFYQVVGYYVLVVGGQQVEQGLFFNVGQNVVVVFVQVQFVNVQDVGCFEVVLVFQEFGVGVEDVVYCFFVQVGLCCYKGVGVVEGFFFYVFMQLQCYMEFVYYFWQLGFECCFVGLVGVLVVDYLESDLFVVDGQIMIGNVMFVELYEFILYVVFFVGDGIGYVYLEVYFVVG